MASGVELFAKVRVIEDVPDRNFGRGTVGTVSHEYPAGGGVEREFEVETFIEESRFFWTAGCWSTFWSASLLTRRTPTFLRSWIRLSGVVDGYSPAKG